MSRVPSAFCLPLSGPRAGERSCAPRRLNHGRGPSSRPAVAGRPLFARCPWSRCAAGLAVIGCLLGLELLQAAIFDPNHALLDRTLKAHVRDALVDYVGLKARRGDLDRYLEEVAEVQEGTFKAWEEAQQLAFLINTYNAATLQLVIDHYPVASIKKIGTWLKGPWDQPVVRLWGSMLTLNDLEHKILRVRYDEPRIHFALVCAARGCPPLRSEAYVASRLGAQLDDQARRFLAESEKNRVDVQGRTVYLSPIFRWYGEDFVKGPGSVLRALLPFWPASVAEQVDEDFKVRTTAYDWTLNERKP